jgi:hypothetical protein
MIGPYNWFFIIRHPEIEWVVSADILAEYQQVLAPLWVLILAAAFDAIRVASRIERR